jgi:hypothetical protein
MGLAFFAITVRASSPAGHHVPATSAGAEEGDTEMPDQKRHDEQHREQRAPSGDQDRSQQNMGNRDREPAEGSRFDQNRNRDRGNQSPGNQQNRNDSGR